MARQATVHLVSSNFKSSRCDSNVCTGLRTNLLVYYQPDYFSSYSILSLALFLILYYYRYHFFIEDSDYL